MTCVHVSVPFNILFNQQVLKFSQNNLLPMSGQVDRASATETVDSGSIPNRVEPKTIKSDWYSQLPCLTFSNQRDSVKPPTCVVDK